MLQCVYIFITFVYTISVHKYMKKKNLFLVATNKDRKIPFGVYYHTLSADQKKKFRDHIKEYLGVYDSTFYGWVRGKFHPNKFRAAKLQEIISHKMK